MKLKSILICLFIACGLALQAQTISVKSFQALPMDMTASSLNGKRIDQNGQVAALIKVVTSQTGFTFEGGTLGIVDTQQRNGEIWVWVPRASRKITILHQQLGVLRDYRYPIEIESERTYEMVLTTGKVETIVKPEITQQYLAFQISPANAVLEVEGELWEVASDGSAMKFVDFGTYNYRVQAPNYHIEVGKVTVNDPEKTQKVVVNLKPDFVEVTLKVDADAEIWVNNEKKGTRTWTGNLGKGTYKIECKQAGHETSMITKEITADLNGETINLPKPTPIYGSLNIESTPNFATIYIDGKEMGETPKSVNEILIGEHEIRLLKDSYTTYKETIVVKKDEHTEVKASLNKETAAPPTLLTQQSKSQQYKNLHSNKKNFVLANVAYSVAPQTSFGITIGSVEKLGWYLSAASNFLLKHANYECNESGEINGEYGDGYTDYTYSDQIHKSRLSLTAGMIVRIAEPVSMYFGGGFGFRNLYWVLEDGTWVKNADYSHSGFSIDGGLLLHFSGFGLSVGVQTIGFNYLETKAGIGFTF